MKDDIQAELLDVFNEFFDAATSADIDGDLPPRFTGEIMDRGRAILFKIQEEKNTPAPQKKEFSLFYSTFTQLEESGELDGFEDVVGSEEDLKTAEKAECPNCQGNCRLVAVQSDKGTLRNFAVCEHCDTAMEF